MPEAMSDERLAEIRAREAAATPGPWTWTPGTIEAPAKGNLPETIMDVQNIPGDYDEDDAAAALGACGERAENDAAANMAFLAAAREDVPALLAEVDRLRERIGRTVALTDLGGYAGPITFVDDENGRPQPHWPTP